MNRLLLAMTVVMVPAVALAVVPVGGTPPTVTPVIINDGAGDQNDPHVSGDWAAYTSNFSINYYRFSTAVNAQIPMGTSARDLLSDISGSKIVFSRVIVGQKTAVMVFDAATAGAPVEIDPALGTTRLGSAIGGNTIAYVDFGLEGNGELVIHDLATSTSQRITNDSNPDQSPSVSPDGNVVTWEHCNASLSNCDIWQAVKSGAGWSVSVTADLTTAEANPDNNGVLVAYDSYRNNNADIFWRAVAGGAEVQLQLAGYEGNPSVAGQYIAFESRPTLGATNDLFVYDLAANRVYQVTNTPAVNEQLNDITVLADGSVRVVWASDEDGPSSRNVKGATFQLNATCVARTVVLEASKEYRPAVYHDGSAAPAPALQFAIPASIPVTEGASANDWVTFSYRLGSGPLTTCKYRGGFSGPVSSPNHDPSKASAYRFHSCHTAGTGLHPQAGAVVTADQLGLHVVHGDTHYPLTAVRVSLAELGVCGADAEAAGCSSTGTGPTVLMLLAVGAWLLLSRRRVAAEASSRR